METITKEISRIAKGMAMENLSGLTALTTKVNGTWMFTKVGESVNISGVPFQDSLKTVKSKGKW